MLSDMPHFIEPVIRLSCSGKVELFEFARKVVLGLIGRTCNSCIPESAMNICSNLCFLSLKLLRAP